MNIKIKASGVACLIGDDYERVYNALVKSFGEGTANIFSKRVAGHEYLQWVLPGDGWFSLANADPFMGAQVRHELEQRKRNVINKFGANRQMAYNVLSVPEDEYVYYKPDANGNIDIKLTAWGYRYPERVDGGNLVGIVDPNADKQHLTLRFESDGNPIENKAFKLNGFNRTSDKEGNLVVGDVPVGTEFDIEIDNKTTHYKVLPGESIILVDCTQYSVVTVDVKVNDEPAEGFTVNVNYGARNLVLTTGPSGKATTRLPHDPNHGICNVTVDEVTKGKPLIIGDNLFEFHLVKKLPEPELPPVIPEEDKDIPEEDKPQPPGLPQPPEEELSEIPGEPSVLPEDDKTLLPPLPEEKVIPEKPPVVPEEDKPFPPPLPEPDNNVVTQGNNSVSTLGIVALALLLALLVAITYLCCSMILFG